MKIVNGFETSENASRKRRLRRERNHVPLTVEISAEVLQESGLAEQSVMEPGHNEAHRCRPFKCLHAVTDSKLDLSVATNNGLWASGKRNGSLFRL